MVKMRIAKAAKEAIVPGRKWDVVTGWEAMWLEMLGWTGRVSIFGSSLYPSVYLGLPKNVGL